MRQAQEARSWEDVAILGRKTLFWYAPKEILYPTHGLVQEKIRLYPTFPTVSA